MNTRLTQALAIIFGLFIFAFALSFFPDAGVTGHVLVDSKTQPLDMTVTQSQSFVISSHSEEPIYITFIRLTGEVIGDGRAEAILDNGRGQRLVVYTNAVKKPEPNLITGMTVKDLEELEEAYTLVLTPSSALDYLSSELTSEEKEFVSGKFANECQQTCLIEMELSKDATYSLEFRVSKGTQLKLDNLLYGLKID